MCGQRPVVSRPAFIWVCVIVALAGLSSFWSFDTSFSLERTFKIALILFPGVLLLGISSSFTAEQIRPYLWLLPVCVALAAALNSTELFFDMPLYRFMRGLGPEANIGLAGANRSIFCTVICFFACIPVLMGLSLELKTRRIAIAGLAALILLMLFLSESQSSQLCFVIGLLFLFVFPYARKMAWAVIMVLMAALIILAPFLAQFLFRTVAENIEGIEWFANGYATNRMEIWEFVGRYALQQPLYGYGIEATRHIKDFDIQMLYHSEPTVLHPHNFAIQLWIEFGLMGAVLSSLFFAYLINTIRIMPLAAARVALPTLFAFISVGATGYGMWQSWWLGECILMLALCSLAGKIAGDVKKAA